MFTIVYTQPVRFLGMRTRTKRVKGGLPAVREFVAKHCTPESYVTVHYTRGGQRLATWA